MLHFRLLSESRAVYHCLLSQSMSNSRKSETKLPEDAYANITNTTTHSLTLSSLGVIFLVLLKFQFDVLQYALYSKGFCVPKIKSDSKGSVPRVC